MEEIKISKKKISIQNLLFNYVDTFFLIVNGLLLVPLYFKYFSLSTYGSYLAVANIAGILGLLHFGLSLVFTQKLSVFHVKKDFKNFSRVLSSGLCLGIFFFLILILIVLIIFPYVPIWVKASTDDFEKIKNAFLFSALASGLTIWSNILASVFQSWLKVKIAGSANVFGVIFGITATFLSLYLGYGVVSISIGIFVKWLMTFLILLAYLISSVNKIEEIEIKYDTKSNLALLKDSLPVFGNSMSKSLIDNAQLLIITNFINPSAAAVFALTNKAYQVCSVVLAPIGSSIYSSLSHLVAQNDGNGLKNIVLKLFNMFTIFSAFILAISFTLNYSFVKIWVGEEKFGGLLLSFLLCVSVFLSSRFSYINFNLFSLGVFGKTALYDQIGAVVRLILIFILIKYIGYFAIPLAELLSIVFVSGFFVYKLFKKEMNLNQKETFQIIFNGIPYFLLFLLMGALLNYLLPETLNFNFFILKSILLISLFCITLVIFSKNIRFFLVKIKNKYLKI